MASERSPQDQALIEDLAMLVSVLAYRLKRSNPDSDMPARATDFLRRYDLASPLGADGESEAERALDLHQQYWLERRSQIVAALAEEGLAIHSDKERVWIHRTRPANADVAQEDVRRLDSGVILIHRRDDFGAPQPPKLYKGLDLRAAIDQGMEHVASGNS